MSGPLMWSIIAMRNSLVRRCVCVCGSRCSSMRSGRMCSAAAPRSWQQAPAAGDGSAPRTTAATLVHPSTQVFHDGDKLTTLMMHASPALSAW